MSMKQDEERARRLWIAAENRAVRRARVLNGSEERLKLLKGQVQTFKTASDESCTTSRETQLDGEILVNNTDTEAPLPFKELQTEFEIIKRVDPLQRRRDAAARRHKKEKMLGHKTEEASQETTEMHSKKLLSPAVSVAAQKGPTLSRHSTALHLHLLEERLVLLLIVVAAVFAAVNMDLSSITASLVADDRLFMSSQDLLGKGVSMDSIRQQSEREQALPEMSENRIVVLKTILEAARTFATTSGFGLLPDVADLGSFFMSLVAHPPVVLCVFFMRLLVSTGAKSVQKALDLPDVKKPQEGDLAFVANLVLSGRPMLKGILVVGHKSLDDVFVSIFVFVAIVAIRAIWFS